MSILISKFSLENVDYHSAPTELGSKSETWPTHPATEATTRITGDVSQLPSLDEILRASIINSLGTMPLSNFETSSMLRDASDWLMEAATQLSGDDKDVVESAATTLQEKRLELDCCNAARFAEIRV